jgi:hypothetical protein
MSFWQKLFNADQQYNEHKNKPLALKMIVLANQMNNYWML